MNVKPPARTLVVAAVVALAAAAATAAERWPAIATDADIDALLLRLSNAGRWGAADERGTLNLIGPAQVLAARALVREGTTVSLAREVTVEGNPAVPRGQYEMLKGEGANRDFVGAIWHGFGQTHLDSLCHITRGPAELYNGHPASSVTAAGFERLGIERMAATGIVARGVLLDIALASGTPLAPGTAVRVADLEAAARRAKVEIQSGDVLFVRTGAGTRNTREARAGLHPECLLWVKEKGVGVLGSDGDNDVAPLPGLDRWASPFHSVGIPHMGLPLVDNAELDALAATAARLQRWEFLVVIAPWRLAGTTSSPVNPIAIF